MCDAGSDLIEKGLLCFTDGVFGKKLKVLVSLLAIMFYIDEL